MIPPPRSTMLLCEERWFGLSMMLKRSAMRKYTNSAARSRAEIIKYISQVFISIFVFVARKAHLFRGGSYHTETIPSVYIHCVQRVRPSDRTLCIKINYSSVEISGCSSRYISRRGMLKTKQMSPIVIEYASLFPFISKSQFGLL